MNQNLLFYSAHNQQITKKWEYALSKEIPQDLNSVSNLTCSIEEAMFSVHHFWVSEDFTRFCL